MSEGDSEFLFDDCWCGRFHLQKQAHSNRVLFYEKVNRIMLHIVGILLNLVNFDSLKNKNTNILIYDLSNLDLCSDFTNTIPSDQKGIVAPFDSSIVVLYALKR